MPVIPNGTVVQIYYQVETMDNYYWFYIEHDGYCGWADIYSLELHVQ